MLNDVVDFLAGTWNYLVGLVAVSEQVHITYDINPYATAAVGWVLILIILFVALAIKPAPQGWTLLLTKVMLIITFMVVVFYVIYYVLKNLDLLDDIVGVIRWLGSV